MIRNAHIRVLFAASILALAGCPSPPNPPTPDSGDAAMLGDANHAGAMCSRLAELGCAEGADPSCAVVVAHVMDAGLTRVNAACIASATSKEAARACGFVRCP
jgi:hypothetical protein